MTRKSKPSKFFYILCGRCYQWTKVDGTVRDAFEKPGKPILCSNCQNDQHKERDIVEAVQIAYAAGEGSHRDIGEMFGMSATHVGRLISGRRRKAIRAE